MIDDCLMWRGDRRELAALMSDVRGVLDVFLAHIDQYLTGPALGHTLRA